MTGGGEGHFLHLIGQFKKEELYLALFFDTPDTEYKCEHTGDLLQHIVT